MGTEVCINSRTTDVPTRKKRNGEEIINNAFKHISKTKSMGLSGKRVHQNDSNV